MFIEVVKVDYLDGFTHFKTTATEGMKMLLESFKNL